MNVPVQMVRCLTAFAIAVYKMGIQHIQMLHIAHRNASQLSYKHIEHQHNQCKSMVMLQNRSQMHCLIVMLMLMLPLMLDAQCVYTLTSSEHLHKPPHNRFNVVNNTVTFRTELHHVNEP